MPIPERTLWRLLRGKNIAGLRFRRQHPLGPYVADFYCHDVAMVVEIDGQSHSGERKGHDDRRDEWMAERGLTIVRFTAPEVTKDPDSVASTILRIVESMQDRRPPPQPSPARGGGSKKKTHDHTLSPTTRERKE